MTEPKIQHSLDRASERKAAAPVTVSVAMCTYNGGPYVSSQLASIAAQTRRPDELIISDDGSEDGTMSRVESFAANAPFRVLILRNQARLGVVGNFERALTACAGNYLALADQDDLWMPTKIEKSLHVMREAERQLGAYVPIMVHSDLTVIDAEGGTETHSFFSRRGFQSKHPEPLRELLLQNYVTGCTTLFNRSLLDLALPIPKNTSIHDWWLALLAAAAGTVITLPDKTVRYRSHVGNVIGAKGVEWRPYVWREKARRLFNRALAESEELERRLSERGIRGAGVELLKEYHFNVRRGGIHAATVLARKGVRLQNAVPTLIFLGHVACGSLRK